MARFTNPTPRTLRFELGAMRYELEPDEACDIPDELVYVIARRGMALVPATDHAAPVRTPTPATPAPLPSPDVEDEDDEAPARADAPDDTAAAIEAAAQVAGRTPRRRRG